MVHSPKGIIFDLDGVITETSKQHFQAWSATANRLGLTLEPAFEEELKGISREDSLKKILALGSLTLSTNQQQRVLEEKNAHYQELIQAFSPHDVFPGMLALFKHLKHKGIRLALGSASKNGPMLLKALAIQDYFDVVVDPRPHRSKPAPDIFLDAALKLGLHVKECWGIEDAHAGVEAIKAAGMFAIGVGDRNLLSAADIVFKTPLEATQWMINHT